MQQSALRPGRAESESQRSRSKREKAGNSLSVLSLSLCDLCDSLLSVRFMSICFHPHRSRIIRPSMPSFPDTAVLVLLALLLFGPKKLPVLARQLGKLMADFRRASNEFRTRSEEELRISEQAERQKQVAAIEAAAPPTAAVTTPTESTAATNT